jgi:hypothetical protein
MTFNIMTFSIITSNIMTFNIMRSIIMTLSRTVHKLQHSAIRT